MDFSKLTEYLNSLESKYEVHGLDCKIMRGHEVLYRHMAGHSDYARTTPVSDHDLYDLYSCTKVITMAGVMSLVEQGKLGLD
ncbi:MAG: serine hydrolase domain-containing protein, partial [Eubacteriales bacterium]